MTFAARSSWNNGYVAPPPPAGPQWVVTYDLALLFPTTNILLNTEVGVPVAITIDWGDGTVDNYTAEVYASHTYAEVVGTATVTITGSCGFIGFDQGCYEVVSWENGLTQGTSFGGVTNLPNFLPTDITYIGLNSPTFNDANVSSWDTSNITNMEGTFDNAQAFNQDISGWNTSAVTSMTFMFNNAYAFNQDISGWDVSSVTSMYYMFSGAAAFNQNIGTWDTAAVISMEYMFGAATAFNGDIGAWNTASVTTADGMFNGAAAFNQDISGWDISGIENMQYMFQDATAFNQPLNAWDVSGVTSMYFMFQGATAFNQPLDTWNVGSVTSMEYMFDNATAFNQNINGWCVTLIPSLPSNFATGSALVAPFYPVWGTCPATPSTLLYAPFTSATTTTDVIPPPLTPTVTIPASTTLTFGATEATFNTLSNPGAFPTVVYGTIGAASKLSPATYPTDSLFISAYIDLTGINNGSIAATTVSEFLKVTYQGNSSASNQLAFNVYLQLSTLTIQTVAQVVALSSNVALEAPGPTSGVHEYSIEWTPDGGAIFRLDDEIVRYSLGATRPTTDFGITVTASGPNYGGASPGGIYESTVRDVSYIYTPYVPTYAFTNSRYNGLYLSNSGRTITIPNVAFNSNYGIITSIPLTGKVYCEFEAVSSPGTGMFNAFGVFIDDPTLIFNFANANGSFIYSRDTFAAGCGASGAGIWINGAESPNTAYEFTYGDRIGIAFDTATQNMWVSINGSYVSGDPAAGTSPSATLTATGPFCFAVSNYDCSAPAGAYVYTMYPSGATFTYAPPVGFDPYDPN